MQSGFFRLGYILREARTLSTTSQRKNPGTNLGLHVCRVELNSDSEGKVSVDAFTQVIAPCKYTYPLLPCSLYHFTCMGKWTHNGFTGRAIGGAGATFQL
jgi:hypothetical protein